MFLLKISECLVITEAPSIWVIWISNISALRSAKTHSSPLQESATDSGGEKLCPYTRKGTWGTDKESQPLLFMTTSCPRHNPVMIVHWTPCHKAAVAPDQLLPAQQTEPFLQKEPVTLCAGKDRTVPVTPWLASVSVFLPLLPSRKL